MYKYHKVSKYDIHTPPYLGLIQRTTFLSLNITYHLIANFK